jgi:hypothetical protein
MLREREEITMGRKPERTPKQSQKGTEKQTNLFIMGFEKSPSHQVSYLIDSFHLQSNNVSLLILFYSLHSTITSVLDER